ncbi:DeoR/GlpR family DNA-binding transcription regulator [Gracilibacillus sp. YIM 98692]|uniref:DeoR/GlpR family DNA-binding transcription regulator n=1 Tax=Gracilibacillus sp. YIM 98692 TaxID=2663532 RepID=UPI0013D419A4|nr:DeoR/GlpR family DNA-binding transcription regulator [Gracilibacillus sp. YIM 98692]
MYQKQYLNSRQAKIYDEVLQNGEVNIHDLVKKFSVADMTIRRDFEKMEKLGLIKRTYGGAIPSTEPDIELEQRESINSEAKKLIGKCAADYIKEKEAIFIDAGTTTPYIVQFLPTDSNLTIVTNALNVASQIKGKQQEKILIGGMLRDVTSSLVGPIAESNLDNLSFDKAFISASGLSTEHGISNANIFEVQIKKKVIQNAKEVNLLVDSSKFEKQFLHKICSFDQIHRIITDKEPGNNYREVFSSHNIDLVVASKVN